jgi:hypothetical protein
MSYDLSPGTSHTFATRSVAGSSTDPTPAIERFTIDATPPETALNSGPMGDTNNQTAEWITSSSERITSGGGFRCSIDGQRTVGCGGDMQYSDLCQGSHTFRSAAFDPASNLDPTPVVAQVNETAGPPCAAPTIGSSTTTTPSPTSASITFPYDDKGAGGTIHLDYGPTAAYGTTIGDQNAQPGLPDVRSIGFGFLAPGTLYHYRLTITTPFGTASTPDQTVTTLPLGGTLPIVGGGSSPTVVGHHAVRIPFTLDPAGVNTSFAILISANGPPIPGDSPSIFFFLQPVKGSSSGPQPANAEIVDLDPGTTYRYRVEAFHSGTDSNSVLGPEGSFTVPAIAPVLAKSHFKLRKNLVAVGKLKRGSRKLTIKVHGLPGDTLVDVGLKVRKAKAKGHKKAAANGKARVTLNFKRKLRKALHKKRVKSATLKVSVTPPGDTVSSVTLRLHLKH